MAPPPVTELVPKHVQDGNVLYLSIPDLDDVGLVGYIVLEVTFGGESCCAMRVWKTNASMLGPDDGVRIASFDVHQWEDVEVDESCFMAIWARSMLLIVSCRSCCRIFL